MSFFDSLKKAAMGAGEAVKNSAITNMEKLWKDMEKLSDERLKSVYKDRGMENTIGYMALLKLASRNQHNSLSFDQATKEIAVRKADRTKKVIELEDSRTFNDIRDAIEVLERKLSSYY